MIRNTAQTRTVRRGFTLTEILVAVGVLLAVVVITGRVFKVATDVTASGQATIDIMQEAAAIEARIRADISHMSRDGFLVIRSVEVPNNVNLIQWQGDGSQGEEPALLNSTLPVDATVRCDQMSFFVDDPTSSQVHSVGSALGTHPSAQGQTAFVTYGHGVQLPELKPYSPEWEDSSSLPVGSPPAGYGHDPDMVQLEADGEELTPWRYDNPGLDEDQWLPTVWTDYHSSVASLYNQNVQIPDEQRYVNGTQPDARQWVLARQAILLADDDSQFAGDDSKRQYLNNVPSAQSIFPHDARLVSTNGLDGGGSPLNSDPPVIAYGRVDVAATPIDQVRQLLLTSRSPSDPRDYFMRRCMHYGEFNLYNLEDVDEDGDTIIDMEPRNVLEGNLFGLSGNPYLDQRFFMRDTVRWPRVERVAPSLTKVDQALVNHALGNSCSSFQVEWTYAEGTGEVSVPNPIDGAPNHYWHGVHYSPWDTLLSTTGDPEYADEPWLGQRWFGLRDIDRGVMPYSDFVSNYLPITDVFVNVDNIKGMGSAGAYAIDPYAIDREYPTFGGNPPYEEYWATFGLNQDQPWLPITEGSGAQWTHQVDRSFTPWPSAVRITMTINDPQGRLEQGQVYQFVVEIPEQARGRFSGGI